MTDDERRKAPQATFNMKLKDLEIECSVVTVGAFGTDPIARTFAVVVPIMSNAVAVKKGDELFLESTVKKETKRKEGSWKPMWPRPIKLRRPKRKRRLRLTRWKS